jgi:Flp pilus assembly protein TadB
MGLGLLGLAGSALATLGPWRWLFVVLIVCAAAFVTVLSMIEKRRRDRILAEIDSAGAPVS